MPPMSQEVAMAVRLAVDGMEIRAAWSTAGCPGGEAGLQNIRKHKRLELAKQVPAPVLLPATPLAPSPTSSHDMVMRPAAAVATTSAGSRGKSSNNGEKVPYRRNKKQMDKQWARDSELKRGYEIVRKFKDVGWCVGRVLKPATDASVKDGQRVANFRIFYECDDELLNQSLYPNTYARDASSAVGTWMLVASRHSKTTMMLPTPGQLALMAPAAP